MWNDEDNNPYGTSFDRRDSQTSSSINPASPSSRDYRSFDAPRTPTSGSEDDEPIFSQATAGPRHESHDHAAPPDEPVQKRKPGGYTSRIEQILYENPSMPILITDAGKSLESGGRYIVYTIRTGDLEVRRRYSEFASLRDALTRLHPTLIIPPIPEKHTMADYAAKPTSAKQDQQIIDLRKRMLAVFLNRCRRMEAIRDDGVWWRFLDPNASWSEVLHSHPISSIPKAILKAPPLDTANPTPAHNFLPVPSTSAKLKTTAGATYDINPSVPQTGTHVIGRFPPDSTTQNEHDLDPYFISYEASIKELEQLLMGPMEKVNRRTLSHLSSLAADLCELGSRYNAFALSEQAPSLGPAIERIGQAADLSYIATEELAGSLGASFAEPMRENAQFAGVVKSVLRYRVLKRVQQDLTTEELAKKRGLLEQLEQSETEARRIEQYLSSSQQQSLPPKRSTSLKEPSSQHRRDTGQDDTESIDSDFPPTHGDFSSPTPSASQGLPERSASVSHKKAPSSNSITNKIFGPLRHAIQGVADVDPERTRRDTIGKTRESIAQLEKAQIVSERDVKEASASVLRDLKRFQKDKEDDLKRYMLAYAKSQIEWAKKSKQQWEEARTEVDKIDEN
ncbi:sorting nexin-41 [Metarhizium album ARSEF 1941]|uniref:Sorting nexin-41 n=1 Tax=Metarhizium album (strain ARSEF 1941) TaxID=1081103 RepID=A0A0B2WNM7_METAS|nr:sorting nexin-41 [Metarhizium album ARSEF 1941]KHN95097.1 sorting nexin-41 [Metarhizium album ARSEF 1941]